MFISFFLYMFLFLKSQNHQCSDGKYGLIDRNAGPYAGHAEDIRKNTVQNNEQQRLAVDEQIGQFILLSRIKISNGDAQKATKISPERNIGSTNAMSPATSGEVPNIIGIRCRHKNKTTIPMIDVAAAHK